MVRNYKRKTEKRESDDDLIKALCAIENGMSIRAAARKFGLAVSTLRRHHTYNKRIDDKATSSTSTETNKQKTFVIKSHGGKMIFSAEEEEALEKYMLYSSDFCGSIESRELVYQFAKILNKTVPQNWINSRMAGPDWFNSFMRRHPNLSQRKSESSETNLDEPVSNRESVKMFFDLYDEKIRKHRYAPYDIWNVDETSLTTVRQSDTLASSSDSSESGTVVTMCLAVNAIGMRAPPYLVFPRVRFQDYFLNGGPVGCWGGADPSGVMTNDHFFDFIKRFQKFTRCSNRNPIFLVLDHHRPHKNPQVITFCRNNGIHLLFFPPQTNHRLQPLDVSVFSPFKTAAHQLCKDWIKMHPGRVMSAFDLPQIFTRALELAATEVNIKDGFRKSGLYPVDRQVVSIAQQDETDEDVKMDEEDLLTYQEQDLLKMVKNIKPDPDQTEYPIDRKVFTETLNTTTVNEQNISIAEESDDEIEVKMEEKNPLNTSTCQKSVKDLVLKAPPSKKKISDELCNYNHESEQNEYPIDCRVFLETIDPLNTAIVNDQTIPIAKKIVDETEEDLKMEEKDPLNTSTCQESVQVLVHKDKKTCPETSPPKTEILIFNESFNDNFYPEQKEYPVNCQVFKKKIDPLNTTTVNKQNIPIAQKSVNETEMEVEMKEKDPLNTSTYQKSVRNLMFKDIARPSNEEILISDDSCNDNHDPEQKEYPVDRQVFLETIDPLCTRTMNEPTIPIAEETVDETEMEVEMEEKDPLNTSTCRNSVQYLINVIKDINSSPQESQETSSTSDESFNDHEQLQVCDDEKKEETNAVAKKEATIIKKLTDALKRAKTSKRINRKKTPCSCCEEVSTPKKN